MTNLSGDITAAPVVIMKIVRKPKKADSMKEMPACIQFLSFGRQLKILSHPCGSGSDRPKTNAFALVSFAPMPSLKDDSYFGIFAAVYWLYSEVGTPNLSLSRRFTV